MENEQRSNKQDLQNKGENAQQAQGSQQGSEDISKQDVLQGMGEGIEKEEEEE